MNQKIRKILHLFPSWCCFVKVSASLHNFVLIVPQSQGFFLANRISRLTNLLALRGNRLSQKTLKCVCVCVIYWITAFYLEVEQGTLIGKLIKMRKKV